MGTSAPCHIPIWGSVLGSLCSADVLLGSEILNSKLSESIEVWFLSISKICFLISSVFILLGDSVIDGDSVCCVGCWKRKAVTVAAMEKGEKQEHLKWYLLGAAWTKFLTMSGH